MTISWFERSSGMIFDTIISDVRSPHLGRLLAAGRSGRRRRSAARPLPPSCATWKISPSFCAISVAAVFLISTIQIFSPVPA